MKIKSWYSKLNLKNKFTTIFILVALIPIIVTSSLVFAFLKIEDQNKIEYSKRIENQFKLTLIAKLKSIASDAELISQNNAFVDFILAPDNLRDYTENRLFGLVHEVNLKSQLKPSFLVLNKNKDIIFKKYNDNNLKNINFEEDVFKDGFFFDGGNNKIYFTKILKYDDQQLSGPASKLLGYLIGSTSLDIITHEMPGLIGIAKLSSTLDYENTQLIIDNKEKAAGVRLGVYVILISGLCLLLAILSGLFIVNKSIIIPIAEITKKILVDSENIEPVDSENEIVVLQELIKSYQSNLQTAQEKIINQSKLSVLVSIASQVSHDIRSPLTALNMVVGSIEHVQEDKRLIIRSAVNRINDIANTLLEKARISKIESGSLIVEDTRSNIKNSKTIELLPVIVDSLVSEKRVQYRNKMSIEIESDFKFSYGAFAEINATDFKRVLSNLINNSVEALANNKGKITISIRSYNKEVQIIIQDNGKGIPSHILSKLGIEPITYGKNKTENISTSNPSEILTPESGNGLGIYHAKKTIEAASGKLEIQSKEDVGTMITITFPRANTPSWFVGKVKLKENQTVLILDDDSSIHQIWQGRFKSAGEKAKEIQIISFTSGSEFKTWINSIKDISAITFLIDYELLEQSQTGLDLIDQLNISSQSILVTSRYEEMQIRDRCQKLGVKLVPKSMATYVPIEISEDEHRIDAILIDDDELVRMTWQFAAKEKSKIVKVFSSFEEFKINQATLNKRTSLYIDSNLGNRIKGEDLVNEISEMGFESIYITTGSSKEEIKKSPLIKGIIGKDPVF